MSVFRLTGVAVLMLVPALAVAALAAHVRSHTPLVGPEITRGTNPTMIHDPGPHPHPSPLPRGTSLRGAQGALHGIAKYYSPGVFEVVARNRKMRMAATPADVLGYAAVADCGRIGQTVLASVGSLGPELYQVLDCVQTYDLAAHEREGLIIEVDYQTAVRSGLVGNDCTGNDGSAQHGCGRAIIYGYLGHGR